MQNMIYVKPREGIKLLLNSNRDFLPPEGAFVENNVFWKRRLRDGDVVLLDKAKKEYEKPVISVEG